MPDDARPFSNCLLDLAPPDIAWFRERSDIVLVPIGSCEQHGAHLPLGHRHDHGARGLAPGRREGRGAVHAAALDRLLAAAHARAGDRRGHDHPAGRHLHRGPLRHRALADPPRLEQARVRERARLEHQGDRPAAAADQVRDRRVRGALQALRRALHRAARRPAREPARRDARLARLRARDVAGDGPRRAHGRHGPRRRGPGARSRSGCPSRSSRPTARRTWSSTATSTSCSRWTTPSSRGPA